MFLLQGICRKIFTSCWENKYLGLLTHAPPEISQQLETLLQRCLDLKFDNLTQSELIFNELYEMLQQSIAE